MADDAELTFEDVIEAHRVEIGVKKVHVSLGPDATPETVATELKKVHQDMQRWEALPETLRLKAYIHRLKGVIHQLGDLASPDVRTIDSETPELRALRHEIFRLTDIIPDVDLKVDTAFAEELLAKQPASAERPDDVERLVREVVERLEEADGCFEAALVEGWVDAIAEGDIERIRDLWKRRISYARGPIVAALVALRAAVDERRS